MREAIGGTVNIFLIAVFITVISGYMAFNVNYTKAFKMKNKIISTIEEYQGECGDSYNNNCVADIVGYADKIGYSGEVPNTNNQRNCTAGTGYSFCKYNSDATSRPGYVGAKKIYYKVTTRVSFDFPIVRNLMAGIEALDVSGNTRLMTEK